MIFFILIAALILRLILINQSFWLDEAIQVLESRLSFFEVWKIPADFHPPLFHYLGHFWLILGNSEWVLRMLPLLLGLGSIYFLYLQAKIMFGTKTANFAAVFLTTSAFHIYYSQEFRPYMLACFLATASYYFFIKFIERKKLSLAYITVNILGLYSLYFFPFVLLSQAAVIIFIYRKKLLLWLVCLLASLFFFIPWLPMFFKQLKVGSGWTINQVWAESVATPLYKVLPLLFIKFWLGNISFDNEIIYGLIGISLLLLTLIILSKIVYNKDKKTVSVLIFLLIPIIASFMVSFFVPVIAPKRLLIVLPQFYLLLAFAIAKFPKKIAEFLAALVISINLCALLIFVFNSRFHREDWRKAVSWSENNCSGNKSIVLFKFYGPFGPWTYYADKKIQTGSIFENNSFVETSMLLLTADKKNICLFDYLGAMTDPGHRVEQWLDANGFTLKKTTDFNGVGFIYSYVK